MQAAPLKVTKEVVYATKKMQAMIVNSGNANACTGKQGVKDAQTMQALAAEKLGIAPDLVGVCSTGVIGEMMKLEPVANGILQLEPKDNLESAIDFAQAILTTDTVMKNKAIVQLWMARKLLLQV